MAKKTAKKITTVRAHPLHVPTSEKNPNGLTIRDQHPRRLKGTYLDRSEIEEIFEKYNRKNIDFPTKRKLPYKNSDKYDELIAVWTDYFNKKFNSNPPLDPDVVKALISSESGFDENPKNPQAIGIAQITRETLKASLDPNGEVKEFIFREIRQKDLKIPAVSIPMAVRWLFRKRRLAEGKLGRTPDAEEIILEYKGLLKSKTSYKDSALKKFRKDYESLKKN